jgi:magnesium transporter
MKSKAGNEIPKTFLFLSDILKLGMVDSQGKILGKLVDLRIKLGELFPPVIALRVKGKGKRGIISFPWNKVSKIDQKVISLKSEAESQTLDTKLKEGEVLLREEILDDQVVDTHGAKVERVNDLHLLLAEGQLRVVHVDFGIRGVLRRLGWIGFADALTNWLFAYRIPEKLLSWKYIQPLSHDPVKKSLKLDLTLRKLSEIPSADLADILEELDPHERAYVFKSLDVEAQADALEEADDKTRVSIIEEMPEERASDILEEMEPDEAVDLLQDLPDKKKQELIQGMEEDKREELEELLEFEEETAGGIMTTGFISCQQTDSVLRAIEVFQRSDDPLDNISYVYVTDQQEKLVGVMTIRDLILSPPQAEVGKIMKQDVVKLRVDDSLKDVAETFKKYKFLTIPVVDKEDHLEGIITLRDGVEAIFPEFGE